MPTEILSKLSPEEVPNIQSIVPDAEIRYTLKVDLEVPVHLHDYFANYPLVSEKQIVLENWLSLYNKMLVHNKNIGEGKYISGEKLVQTLFTKRNYVVHYQALQTYMKFEIKITKVHTKVNEDEFEIIYYKLKNKAVFDKQIENVCKHMRVELLQIKEDKKIRHLASSLLFVGFKQFEEGITAVHILKIIVTLNKPIYLEQAILNISKAIMFNF
ncbi:15394_t:CDS:2 [Cetraspora pellucida]|uniref:15394_t:CDS:1 n=1 Tax=Cetraspora pellucida TaxID=1433469 RepID=A0ACA9MCZ0_9GLOM|nr:15394_t:CDS:2 [Cetraspora pellucida]